MASKGTPATALLSKRKIAFTLHEYVVDPAAASYGEGAAAAIGVDPARVFKTLVADVDGRLTVGVVPVTGSLNLKALAAAVGGKRAAMAEPAAAERATGYVTGGISPVAQRSRLPIVIDTTAERWPTIYVSAGKRGLQAELTPTALISLTEATLADIAA